MAVIATVVGHLDRLADIAPALHELAVRHVDYGVKHADYETAGAALIWTLQKGLGEDFSRPCAIAGFPVTLLCPPR